MNTRILILCGALLFGFSVVAQEANLHVHQQNEVGLSVGGAYDIAHGEWNPVIHTHFFRAFTPHSRWAWGVGLEIISGEENHVELGAGMRYLLMNRLQLSVMPGISLGEKAQFSLHAEAVYELLNWKGFHLGPVVGYGWTRNHAHCSIGVHMAFAFGATNR